MSHPNLKKAATNLLKASAVSVGVSLMLNAANNNLSVDAVCHDAGVLIAIAFLLIMAKLIYDKFKSSKKDEPKMPQGWHQNPSLNNLQSPGNPLFSGSPPRS